MGGNWKSKIICRKHYWLLATTSGKEKMMKKNLFVSAIVGFILMAGGFAAGATYNGDVEYSAGAGSNSATIAVDFDLDNSFLFTYNWDGAATGEDALLAIVGAGDLEVTTIYEGAFVADLSYPGGVKYDYGLDMAGWSYYTSSDGDNWDFSMVGFAGRSLTNNDWDSWVWTNFDVNWDAVRGPGELPVPEPTTIALLGLGGILLGSRRKTK